MFFIDLVDLYKDLIPPTIAKKKNETERRMPIRKRTAPVDLRMSRSRLSVGTEARDWLLQQRLSGKIPAPSPVPAVPKLATPVPPSATATPAPASAESPSAPATEAPKSKPEPKPEVEPVSPSAKSESTSASSSEDSSNASEPAEAKPASPPAQSKLPNVPPPPAFKEPRPELDRQPPRPSFKEPPPEADNQPPRPPAFAEPDLSDVTPIPRPNFAEPPPETDDEPTKDPSVFSSRQGSLSPARSGSPRLTVKSPTSPGAERSPSPLRNQDAPLGSGKASLARSGSNEGPRAVRGPRGSRPPRTGGGGSVSQMVSSLNRQSGSEAPRSPAAGSRRPISGISDSKRSSLTGARGSLARRTMDSDAEDNVVQ